MVRRTLSFLLFVLVGGCALLTGANDLEIERSPAEATPSGSGVGSGASGASGGVSGGLPSFDGGGVFPFGDGGLGSSGGGPVLDGGAFPDGAKPDPRAGVSCGNATCAPGGHCCLTAFGAYQCATSCGGTSVGDLACDDAYDCPGKVCCGEMAGSVVGAAQCKGSCNDPDSLILCAGDQDCPSLRKCEPVETPIPSKFRACSLRD